MDGILGVMAVIAFFAILAWVIRLEWKDAADLNERFRRFIAWRDKQKDHGQTSDSS